VASKSTILERECSFTARERESCSTPMLHA
jgi:hypothetical protein